MSDAPKWEDSAGTKNQGKIFATGNRNDAQLNCLLVIAFVMLVITGFSLAVSKLSKAKQPDVRAEINKQEPDAASTERNEAIDVRVEAENNLRATLKDGDSAKLQGLFVSRLSGGGYALCGEVNAKNSFGAYTGYQRFVAPRNSEAPTFVDDGNPIFDQVYARFCARPIKRF